MKSISAKFRFLVSILLLAILITSAAYLYYPAEIGHRQTERTLVMVTEWIQRLAGHAREISGENPVSLNFFIDHLKWNTDFIFIRAETGDSVRVWPEHFRGLQEEVLPARGLIAVLNDQVLVPVYIDQIMLTQTVGTNLLIGWSAGEVLYQQHLARQRILHLGLLSFLIMYGINLIYNLLINRPLKRITNHAWLLSRGQPLSDASAGGSGAEFHAMSEYLRALSDRLLSLQKLNKELPKRLDDAVKQANLAQTILDRELKRMSALIFLSIQFKQETSRDSILKRLTLDITEQIGYQISILFVHENHHFKYYASSIKGLTVLNDTLKQNMKNYVISAESPEYLEMQGKTPYITSRPHFRKILESNNIKTRLATVPIFVKDQLIGMLFAGNIGEEQKLDDKDLEKLTLLCNIVSLNIENLESITNLHRNVQQRTEELETTNKLLAESIRERDNVLKLVSHDLNAPLRNVVGLVDSIERKYGDALPEDVLNRIQRIRNNVEKERQMIKDVLLNFRAIESGMGTEDVDIYEILMSIKEELQLEFEKKSIEFIISQPLPKVWAQPHLIKHIFLNLLDNAVKYMPENSDENWVKIDAKETAEEITYSVADNGQGIPQEKQLDIFLSYTSFQNIRELEYTGLGLGLALVKNIVEKMSGKIWVKSKPGEGTTFFISFRKARFQRILNN